MKKNNKGFSLVELIVVVLIMGIIAVALAPQVMKWVDKARTNSDTNTAKDLKSSFNTAIADALGDGVTVTAFTDVEVSSTGIAAGCGDLADYIVEVLGDDYPTTSAGAGKYFKASISEVKSGSWKVEINK